MTLDKAIEHGKEKRKPYYGGKRFFLDCRPGGDCPWCAASRLRWRKKLKQEERDARNEA